MTDTEPLARIIIPPAVAEEIVAQASQVFRRECACRAEERACPPDTWDVCLLFADAAPGDLQGARPVPAPEALAVVRTTKARGAVFQLFFRPDDHRLTELCSCCSCCCRPLRRIRREGRYGELLRSAYLAVTDPEHCNLCELCLDSCLFGARRFEDHTLVVDQMRCLGCGRCVADCPEDAIQLVAQPDRGVPIPRTA